MHQSCAIRVIALGAALSLVGACGSRVDNSAAGLTSEEQVELVEEFVGVTLPHSTADLEVYQWVGIDEAVAARFLLDPNDLGAFLASGDFEAPPREGVRPIFAGEQLGWQLDDIEHMLGHDEVVDSFSRQLLIDVDDPQRPVVYLLASTL